MMRRTHCEEILLRVKVIKVFSEVRTPCPLVGTVGEWYDIDGEYCCVRFPLPMEDTEVPCGLVMGRKMIICVSSFCLMKLNCV